MRIEIKFTESNARNTFYFLNSKYGTKLKYSQKNLAKLSKVAILTEASSEAKIHADRLEKILPEILAQE